MKTFSRLTYTEKIRWRIRFLRMLIVAMIIYMVIVGETGGDSRIMTDFADTTSDMIFWGGLIYILFRISSLKKLLNNRLLLKEQMRLKQDERNQYLHDKSGGIVVDILLIVLLFVTMTSGLYNMTAFYVSAAILAVTILLKVLSYIIWSHKQ